MTKYQELVEEVKNMDQLRNSLKAKVDDEFIKGLAGYLGCNVDKFGIEFGKLDYHDKSDIIIWYFTLVIRFDEAGRVVSLPGFSLTTLKKTALEFPVAIMYIGAGAEATTEDIHDAIFKTVNKTIIELSQT